MSFGNWLWERQGKGIVGVDELAAKAGALKGTWPISSMDRHDYEVAIKGSSVLPDSEKDAAIRHLQELWPQFKRDVASGGSGAPQGRVLNWLAANSALIVTLIIAVSLVILMSGIFFGELLENLKDQPTARGLITFLFSILTVGIFIIVVVSNFMSSLGPQELAVRFQNGKDVLTLLIGVFGTIVGFYFGQATAGPPSGPATTVQTAPGPVQGANGLGGGMGTGAVPSQPTPTPGTRPES